MSATLIHVGFGNYVAKDRVRGVETPASAPVQRLIRKGKQENATVDLTSGRRTKLVLFMDTGHLFLLGIARKEWHARSNFSRPAKPAQKSGD